MPDLLQVLTEPFSAMFLDSRELLSRREGWRVQCAALAQSTDTGEKRQSAGRAVTAVVAPALRPPATIDVSKRQMTV